VEESLSPSWHLYLLKIRDAEENQRDAVMARIDAAGVSVNVHFQPLPLLSAYKELGYRIDDHPRAYDLYSRTISLPIFFDMTDSQVDRVIQVVQEAVAIELG
jgi:dTDP-4-amino-4,6-dideoxygalactose transaminase